MDEKEYDALLMKRKAEEESMCLSRLSDFVQNHIVPTDPIFYFVQCKTIDVAIQYRIKILEQEVKDLKKKLNDNR